MNREIVIIKKAGASASAFLIAIMAGRDRPSNCYGFSRQIPAAGFAEQNSLVRASI